MPYQCHCSVMLPCIFEYVVNYISNLKIQQVSLHLRAREASVTEIVSTSTLPFQENEFKVSGSGSHEHHRGYNLYSNISPDEPSKIHILLDFERTRNN